MFLLPYAGGLDHRGMWGSLVKAWRDLAPPDGGVAMHPSSCRYHLRQGEWDFSCWG